MKLNALITLDLSFLFKHSQKYNRMTDCKNFEVIIIGGSYSGLSAAMALGRSLRSVLIIDSGLPCNRQAPHAHNFITQDGEKPGEIAAKARVQVLKYKTVQFLNGLAVSGKKTAAGFEITTQTGDKFLANKLIFATGVKDIMPEINGFAECWGNSVIPCPYCHGYEYRNEKTGILLNGEMAFGIAKTIHNWTDDLTIFTNGKSTLTEEQLKRLTKHNIQIVESEIDYFLHQKGEIENIVFKDNSSMALKALYALPEFEQHCKIPQELGCELTEQNHIQTDPFQKTTVPGVFACGDNSNRMRSIASAVATGGMTGVVVNMELIEEAF